jgi:3-phosphoshikimate 1-carboxyvinyltransferase
MDARPIRGAQPPLDVVLHAPPSKSVTHRALVAAALASGRSVLRRPLDADDTRRTLAGLVALGTTVDARGDAWVVEGSAGRLAGGGRLDLGESGTSLRLLAAVAALGDAASELDGGPRLRERPLHELATALGQVGAQVLLGDSPGGLPARFGGRRPLGGAVLVPGSQSSQFASALLLVGPRLAAGIDVSLEPPVVSAPYIELTAEVLGQFGVTIERRGPRRFVVPAQDYVGREIAIEGDHSSASYFLAAACVVGGRVRVHGLRPDSAQPDARLGPLLAGLGCRVESGADWVEVRGAGGVPGFDIDLADAPDLVPTMAVLGLFAGGACTIRGVAHLRLKESDRLSVLATNLRALGRGAVAEGDRLRIAAPTGALHGERLPSAADHRIAMAFAVAGLRQPDIHVEDPDCVAKSHPRFWEDFTRLERR